MEAARDRKAEPSIKGLMEDYGIQQSTAYKWRSALRDRKLEESWENYDRINSREINLSEAVRSEESNVNQKSNQNNNVVSLTTVQQQPQIEVQQTATMPAADSGFGLSIGRLQELNSEAELEVLVKSKLKDYHESRLQSERSQELKSKIAEVRDIDPKQLGSMLNSLGI